MARTRKKPEAGTSNDVPAAVECAAPAAPPPEAAPAPRKRPARRPPALPALAPELAEAASRAEGLGRQLREVGGRMEELVRESHAHAEALRAEREQVTRELQAMREQTQAGRQELLREARAAAERLRDAVAGAEGGLARAQREFRQAGAELGGEVGRVRQEIQEAGQALGPLPVQAEEVGQKLKEMQAQLRGLEEAAAASRRELEALREAEREAQARLDALRQETAAAESRRDALARETAQAESHLAAARLALEETTRQAARRAEEERFAEGKNRLGVAVDPGVVVAEVQSGSPAAEAGLLAGDVVTSVDASPVHTGPELRDAIQAKAAGEEVSLRVTRGGLVTVLHVTLPALLENGDGSEGKNRLGMNVDPGVVVADVLPGSPAAAAGLARGDVITAVNGKEVLSGTELRDAIASLEEHAEVKMQFRRAGEPREANVQLDVPAGDAASKGMA